MIRLNFLIILVVALPTWLWLRRLNYIKDKEHFSSYRESIVNIFFIYILGVVYFTLKPFDFIIPLMVGKTISFDFNLFSSLRNMAMGDFRYQLLYSLGNIVMLIPFGLLMPMLFKYARSFLNTVLLGFTFSLTIELTQTFFTMTRSGTVDDLFFNTLGAAIGYTSFLILMIINKKYFAR